MGIDVLCFFCFHLLQISIKLLMVCWVDGGDGLLGCRVARVDVIFKLLLSIDGKPG